MPSSSGEVDIMNVALIDLGEPIIVSRSDNNKHARAMDTTYEFERDSMLRENRWKFAIQRTTLTADPVAPLYQFTTRFAIPADYLYMIETQRHTDYRREGGFVLSDSTDSLKIKYVKRVTDPTQFDPMFANALSKKLSVRNCMTLTKDLALRDRLEREYRILIIDAKKFDGMEDDPEQPIEDDWISVRTGGQRGLDRSGTRFT